MPGLQIVLGRRFRRIDFAIFRLDRERAPFRHRVASIDGQIYQRVFELACIHKGRPRLPGKHHLDPDSLAKCAAEQIGHPCDQRIHVGDLRRQRLASREGQQAVGQQGGARGAAYRRRDMALQLVAGRETVLEVFQVAQDDCQQVVEIVRDAAGELTDRLHLLRLAQRLFDLRPAGHFLADALLEVFIQRPQPAFGGSEPPFRPISLGDVAKGDQGALDPRVLDKRGSVDRKHDPAIVGRGEHFDLGSDHQFAGQGASTGQLPGGQRFSLWGPQHPRHVLVSPPFQLGAPGAQYPLRRCVDIEELAARGHLDDPDRRGIQDAFQPGAAAAQLGFGLLSLGLALVQFGRGLLERGGYV